MERKLRINECMNEYLGLVLADPVTRKSKLYMSSVHITTGNIIFVAIVCVATNSGALTIQVRRRPLLLSPASNMSSCVNATET